MSTELAALVGESYERAYTDMVRVQQLTELEEVIKYKKAIAGSRKDPTAAQGTINFIRELWRRRLLGVQHHVEVWQSLFSVRSLVVAMHEDVDSWLKFVSLCRKSNRPRQAEKMLLNLLRYDPRMVQTPGTRGYGAGSGNPNVMLAYVKHLWATGNRQEALSRLTDLVKEIANIPAEPQPFTKPDLTVLSGAATGIYAMYGAGTIKKWQDQPRPALNARAYLQLGLYAWRVQDPELDGPTIAKVLGLLRVSGRNSDCHKGGDLGWGVGTYS